MKIVLTGAGSGGHITPILAIAKELKRIQPEARIIYIGQTGDKLGDIPAKHHSIDEVYSVRAGKFRRYHGEGLKQFLDIRTWVKNVRDFFYFIAGTGQSRKLLKRLKPDIIFIKGGFVGVPIGLAAAQQHIPYITHDSDAIPGLANRIIARWAKLHAVAMPADLYKYPADKTVTTGIPLQDDFKRVDKDLKIKYRKQLDISDRSKVLFIIGGGLGSRTINNAVTESVPHLLREFPDLIVLHVAGRDNFGDVESQYKAKLSEAERGRLKLLGYVEDVYRYSGAADLVITRAGATNLAEFALQAKACVIVPSPFLTGGHQLKNAAYLEQKQAAVIISEEDINQDPLRLAKKISELLVDENLRTLLADGLSKFAVPNATQKLAAIIIDTH